MVHNSSMMWLASGRPDGRVRSPPPSAAPRPAPSQRPLLLSPDILLSLCAGGPGSGDEWLRTSMPRPHSPSVPHTRLGAPYTPSAGPRLAMPHPPVPGSCAHHSLHP